eukprot:503546_1
MSLFSSINDFYKGNLSTIRNQKILSKQWAKSAAKLSITTFISSYILNKGYTLYQYRKINTSPFQPKIVIIGAGMSGICAAIRIKQELNYHNFVIIERDDEIGGTWLRNNYPGCSCDIPGINYSFSFANPRSWTPAYYPTQAETLKYNQDLCKKYELYKYIQFNTLVTGMTWNQHEKIWNISLQKINNTLENIDANIVISAVGILSNKKIPKFKNMNKFKGHSFHSSEYDNNFDVNGKNVGVIGSGPTAVQVIPSLGKMSCNKLIVFQRSIGHLSPKTEDTKTTRKIWYLIFIIFPILQKFMRFFYYFFLWDLGGFYPCIKRGSKKAIQLEQLLQQHREEEFKDRPDLLKKTVPPCRVFGKRILLHNTLFETYKQENCEIVTDKIDEFTENGIKVKSVDGTECVKELDCVVYCTGFRAQEFLSSIKDGVIGKNGRNLQSDVWDTDNCFAYLGVTVTGYPNLFMLYGPGTNLGHNSVIFMIECACQYTIECVRKMINNCWNEVDVKKDVMDKYVEKLDKENQKNAWFDPNITNWYSNNKGRGSTNWAWSTTYYWWLTKSVNWKEYNVTSISSKSM